MTRRLVLILCLLLTYLSMFLGAEPVQAVPTVGTNDVVAFQKTKANELRFNSSNELPSNIDSRHISVSDADFPKQTLEAFNPTIIEDGFLTGKTVGYKLGKSAKDYSCDRSIFKCSVGR